MITRVHFIRHGQIDSNISGALDTAVPGPPLNALGLTQASQLVGNLAGIAFDAMYVSTATRAQQTAAPLAAALGLTPLIFDDIREISAGRNEMSLVAAHRVDYHGTIDRWCKGELDLQLAGGTTGREVLARADRVFDRILAGPHREVAVVAHGALIAYWTAMRGAGLTEELLANHGPHNTGYTVLEADNTSAEGLGGASAAGAWRCVEWMGQPVQDSLLYLPARDLQPAAE